MRTWYIYVQYLCLLQSKVHGSKDASSRIFWDACANRSKGTCLRIIERPGAQSYISIAYNMPLPPKPQWERLFFTYPKLMINRSQATADLSIPLYQRGITGICLDDLHIGSRRHLIPWFLQSKCEVRPLWAHPSSNIEGKCAWVAR